MCVREVGSYIVVVVGRRGRLSKVIEKESVAECGEGGVKVDANEGRV